MSIHYGRGNGDLNDSLKKLFDKYNVAITGEYELRRLSGATDVLHLLPGWKFSKNLSENCVPLLPWRSNRKFNELKSIVENQTIEDVALMRLSCYSIDPELWPLKSLLYRELDLCEYLSGSTIATLNHVTDKCGERINIVAKLVNGILCSIEIGMDRVSNFSMPPLIERHEIIGARGTGSDLVVDTQIPQSSIYVFTKDESDQFTDIDMELYGHSPSEVDHIRSAFYAYQNRASVEELKSRHIHLTAFVDKVLTSMSN